MIPLYAPGDVRTMDEKAIAAGTPSLVLMERAAAHLAVAVREAGGFTYGLRVGVLCGKGNNGGDGLAAARLLIDAGAAPRVCLVAGERGLSEDGLIQLERLRRRGGRIVTDVAAALKGAHVAVDCLLGTGTTGAPRPPLDDAVHALHAFPGPVVAADLPTGVDGATGAVAEPAVRADVTVTFGAEKVGLRLWPARGRCGRLVVGDLDTDPPGAVPAAGMLEAADVRALLGAPAAGVSKRDRGVVVALAGSPGMTGAAVLVARGALAGGAGLVTILTDEPAPLVGAVPEVLTRALPADEDARFEAVLAALEGATALAVGPGLGRDEATVALVRRIVDEVELPLVLDADGLNAFRHEGDRLSGHASRFLVLTPHAREYARLLGEDVAAVWPGRLADVVEHARRWNAVLVAKGPGSLVGAPGGACWVNPTGSAELATGGTGDVLTGMLAAIVAGGPTAERVAAGVWLHGLAGEEAGRISGSSTTAGSVAAAVPLAWRRIEEAA